MKNKRLTFLFAPCLMMPVAAKAQATEQPDTLDTDYRLSEVVVKSTPRLRSTMRVENMDIIGQRQLMRAACC
ncbi:MAG: hypothetical protein Q4B68_10585, partial [Bacteroidales bacterium]|nr:hypothetical protein [Bacteroidales bacterium]